MVHGFLGNLAVRHLSIVPALRKQFRITTLDLRGHGYSDVTPHGVHDGEAGPGPQGPLVHQRKDREWEGWSY